MGRESPSEVSAPAADSNSHLAHSFLNLNLPRKWRPRFMTPVANTNRGFSPASRAPLPSDELPCFRSEKPFEDISRRFSLMNKKGLTFCIHKNKLGIFLTPIKENLLSKYEQDK